MKTVHFDAQKTPKPSILRKCNVEHIALRRGLGGFKIVTGREE